MTNYYMPFAADFSQKYQNQVFAADQQRRANQGADSAFAQMASDDDSELVGQPTPQAPSSPMMSYGDGLEGPVDSLERDNEIMSRAKKRAAQYLSEAG